MIWLSFQTDLVDNRLSDERGNVWLIEEHSTLVDVLMFGCNSKL
jgi:hypothetical protein